MRRILTIVAAAVLLAIGSSTTALANDQKKKPKKKHKTEAFKVVRPTLTTAADSTAYLFGLSQSQGLSAYIQQQFNVDTAYLDDFARGVMERVGVDTSDKQAYAYAIGQQRTTMLPILTKKSIHASWHKPFWKDCTARTKSHPLMPCSSSAPR